MRRELKYLTKQAGKGIMAGIKLSSYVLTPASAQRKDYETGEWPIDTTIILGGFGCALNVFGSGMSYLITKGYTKAPFEGLADPHNLLLLPIAIGIGDGIREVYKLASRNVKVGDDKIIGEVKEITGEREFNEELLKLTAQQDTTHEITRTTLERRLE